jgi:protein-S-isoprenylcysteine O-methyltransferase Ste14
MKSLTASSKPENKNFLQNLLNNQKGMNIVGQGGKIILFTLPALIGAILANIYFPQISALPEFLRFLQPLGYVLLLLGLLLWGTAIVQLFAQFPKGKLVTRGAYGVVRNPIYSSVTVFILPAVSLLTFTWVYFVPSIFLYAGVMIFIGVEEEQLKHAFGKEYEAYLTRVDRMIPFKKP